MGKEYKAIKKLLEEELKEGSIVELGKYHNGSIKKKTLVTVSWMGKNNCELALSNPIPSREFPEGRTYIFTIWPNGTIINPSTGRREEEFYSDYRVIERAE